VTATRIATIVGLIAVVSIGTTGLVASLFSPLSIPFILWSLVPYGLLYAVALGVPKPWLIGGAGAAALAADLGIRAQVFLFARSSTAAIALIVSPIVIAIVAMPAGALVGWGFGYAFVRTGLMIRTALTSSAIVVLGFTFIGFARPDLFPTTVRARNEALAAIGEPRVVVGGDRFTRTLVSDASSWKVVGEFDGKPGDELALVSHKGAQLFDVATMRPIRFLAFGGETGQLWGPYSRLVRVGDAFVVAQTGGGYSDTQVMSLDNTLLWRFHPDPRLSPTAMLPGDLDEDGEIEFYASTSDALTRLDLAGAQVWRRPVTLSDLVSVMPSSRSEPPWIVGARYGVSVDVWSPAGTRIAEMTWPGDPVLGIVDWPSTRSLLVGGVNARVLGLDRTQLAELVSDPLMRVWQGVSWKPDAGSPSLLAIVSGGDEFLKRWRLRVYAGPAAIAYDEVFDEAVRLLVARSADDSATLFIIKGSTLAVLRGAQ
jgi:hypothetical protein